ncbi:MAG: CpsD/CapB family tyrosine-protein kinase [Bacteroidota bacterium]
MKNEEKYDLLIDPVDDENENPESEPKEKRHEKESGIEIERTLKPVIFNANHGKSVNEKIVNYHLYNSFNYSLFINGPSGKNKNIKCMLGVTSANQGEGKTTTACNLATALSLSSQRKTILIDLNTYSPRIHEIFGMPNSPGFSDALLGDEICVTPTQIENLSVLPSGNLKILPPNRLINFNIVAYSLLQKFEFLIVDMTSVDSKHFPTLIANQLNGLIVVVESSRTKRRDISRLFRRVNEKNVIGFVMNKANDEDF